LCYQARRRKPRPVGNQSSVGNVNSQTNRDSRPQGNGAASGARILVVDDNRANHTAIDAVIEPLHHTVMHAYTGKQALRLLLSEQVDLVVMDVQMPEMDGYETVRMMRRRDRLRDLPVLFLSAICITDKEIDTAYGLGAVDFVIKPFVPEIFRARVNAILANRPAPKKTAAPGAQRH
jgi:CheY-like chemotaxis protein